MKKAFALLAGIFLIFLVSCSNPQNPVLTSQEDTLRTALKEKSNKTIWTKELEADRLSVKLNSNINVLNKEMITPQMLNSIKELQPAVYPEIKGYASLDSSSMNASLLSVINEFSENLCKSTENLETYFVSEYFFNYVFFKADFDPMIEKIKTDDIIFDRYVICKAFESSDIVQVPLRFYNKKDFVDLSVYLTYHNGYKITQIEVIRWGKTYGESDKEQSKK